MTTLRLQGIGIVKGTPAGEIRIGTVLIWNYGERSTVTDIVKETKKTIVINEVSDSGYKGQRRLSKTRLVAIR